MSSVGVRGGFAAPCDGATIAITSLTGPLTAKLPVVLTQQTLQINLNSKITLPEPALEIKDIKKHVKVKSFC